MRQQAVQPGFPPAWPVEGDRFGTARTRLSPQAWGWSCFGQRPAQCAHCPCPTSLSPADACDGPHTALRHPLSGAIPFPPGLLSNAGAPGDSRQVAVSHVSSDHSSGPGERHRGPDPRGPGAQTPGHERHRICSSVVLPGVLLPPPPTRGHSAVSGGVFGWGQGATGI